MKNGLFLIAVLGLAGCASGISPPPLPSRTAKRVAVNHDIPSELQGRIIIASYGISRLDSARLLDAKNNGFSSGIKKSAGDNGVITPQHLLAVLHHSDKLPKAKQTPTSALKEPAIKRLPLPPIPVKPPAPPLPHWSLVSGQLVGRQLAVWAVRAGWTVQWDLNQDWSVPVATEYQGDFVKVAGNVVQALAADGVSIRAKFYEGNHVLVVSGGR